jgi:uncharacterized protein YqjF (DUF2071 family)
MAHPADLQAISSTCQEPVPHPLMLQSWCRLTFLHWRYDPAVMQRLLPDGLVVDVFDGSAWVGLVPFEIYGLRPAGMPALPWLSHFPETNIRTYAVGPDGSRGVWFFSLDAARWPAVIGARTAYGLPYFWASMRVSRQEGCVRYESRRQWPRRASESTDISIAPGCRYVQAELTELDHFLTARYRLFTMLRGKLGFAPVEHRPWPLARAQALELRESLLGAAGLSRPAGEPLVHYSEDISVRVGAPRIL